MGCGSSVAVNVDEGNKSPPKPAATSKIQKVVTVPKAEVQPLEREALQPIKPQFDRAKSIMFEIPLHNEDQKTLNSNIDSILSRPIAKRSQLAPLSLPLKLNGDENDNESTSLKLPKLGPSRRRAQLMSARRTSRHLMAVDGVPGGGDEEDGEVIITAEMIQEKMDHAQKAREAKLLEIQEKQKRREERAIRARQRAQLAKQENLEYEEEMPTAKPPKSEIRKDDFFEKSTVTKLNSPSSSGYNSREVSAGSNVNAHNIEVQAYNPRGGGLAAAVAEPIAVYGSKQNKHHYDEDDDLF